MSEIVKSDLDGYELIGLPSEAAIKALTAFCAGLIGTPFIPKSLMIREPGSDASDEDWKWWRQKQASTMLAVCLTGREAGFAPMQALRAYWLSPDGRLGMYADAAQALMLKNGAVQNWDVTDDRTILTTKRGGNTYTTSWSQADATVAGLQGQHKKYPRAMAKARVLGDTYRTLFPDVGGNGVYMKEELEEFNGPFNKTEAAEVAADKRAAEDDAYRVEVVEPPKERAASHPDRKPEPKAERAVEIKPEPPQAQTVASDDDVPQVNGKPTHEAAKTVSNDTKSRFKRILSSDPEAKLSKLHLINFLDGWRNKADGLNEAAATEGAWDDPLTAIEDELISDDALALKPEQRIIPQLIKDGVKCGKVLRKAWDHRHSAKPALTLKGHYPSWTQSDLGLAQAAIANHNMSGEKDFIERFDVLFRPVPVGSDLSATLTLYALDLMSYALFNAAKTGKKPMTEVFQELEKNYGKKITLDTPRMDMIYQINSLATTLRIQAIDLFQDQS